jgi:hypothetical protein
LYRGAPAAGVPPCVSEYSPVLKYECCRFRIKTAAVVYPRPKAAFCRNYAQFYEPIRILRAVPLNIFGVKIIQNKNVADIFVGCTKIQFTKISPLTSLASHSIILASYSIILAGYSIILASYSIIPGNEPCDPWANYAITFEGNNAFWESIWDRKHGS